MAEAGPPGDKTSMFARDPDHRTRALAGRLERRIDALDRLEAAGDAPPRSFWPWAIAGLWLAAALISVILVPRLALADTTPDASPNSMPLAIALGAVFLAASVILPRIVVALTAPTIWRLHQAERERAHIRADRDRLITRLGRSRRG